MTDRYSVICATTNDPSTNKIACHLLNYIFIHASSPEAGPYCEISQGEGEPFGENALTSIKRFLTST